jgi:cytochrome c-type biogenesis protein CcmH/NrfG
MTGFDPFTLWVAATAIVAATLAVLLLRLRSRRATAIVLVAAVAALALVANAMLGDRGEEPLAFDAGSPLQRHVAKHPRDARAMVLLARSEIEADRFAEAAMLYERALAASRKVAADPGVWCEYADALGMAQGGALAGKPLAAIERALAMDGAHPKALEMAGSAAYEQKDYAGAVRHWRRLLAAMPGNAPGRDELSAAIARAERLSRMAMDELPVRSR